MSETQGTQGKWYVVNPENNEVYGTRGKSKEEATNNLCVQLAMLHGFNYDWSYWEKHGFKVRRD